jgi:hypothetical protein
MMMMMMMMRWSVFASPSIKTLGIGIERVWLSQTVYIYDGCR